MLVAAEVVDKVEVLEWPQVVAEEMVQRALEALGSTEIEPSEVGPVASDESVGAVGVAGEREEGGNGVVNPARWNADRCGGGPLRHTRANIRVGEAGVKALA